MQPKYSSIGMALDPWQLGMEIRERQLHCTVCADHKSYQWRLWFPVLVMQELMSYLLLLPLREHLSMASTMSLEPFPRSVGIVSNHVQCENVCDIVNAGMGEVSSGKLKLYMTTSLPCSRMQPRSYRRQRDFYVEVR